MTVKQPAMQRTEAWHREQAEKKRRELEALFEGSARSRTPATRMYPHLSKATFRQGEIARSPQQQTAPTAAARLYPNLKSGSG
jgi:hypothetical protein